MTEQADQPARRRLLGPIILLSCLVAVSVLLHVEKFRRGKDVLKLQTQHGALVRARSIEETKSLRARFYQIRYFLGYPVAVSYAAADFLRRVDAITPPLRLLAVQIEPALHDLGFELRVGVAAARPGAARRKLGAFLKRLRNASGVSEAELSPQPGAAGENGLRVFVVNGRVDLQ